MIGDGHGLTATVSDNVTGQPPVANPDTAHTNGSSFLSIPVTANDTDPDHDSLSVAAIPRAAAHGTATGYGSAVSYQPNASYNGSDFATLTKYGAIFAANGASVGSAGLGMTVGGAARTTYSVSGDVTPSGSPIIPSFTWTIPVGADYVTTGKTFVAGNLLSRFQVRVFNVAGPAPAQTYTAINYPGSGLPGKGADIDPTANPSGGSLVIHGNQATWTPSPTAWSSITATTGTKAWVVLGGDKHRDAPDTGLYWGSTASTFTVNP